VQQQVALAGSIFATGPRAVIAAVIGNGLEWYNSMLYGVFASIIAKLLFPTANALTSLLLSLGTFAVGVFMHPLGAPCWAPVLCGGRMRRVGRKARFTKQARWAASPQPNIATWQA
jgi:MFS transporter, MHS family, proline/betaine transporter